MTSTQLPIANTSTNVIQAASDPRLIEEAALSASSPLLVSAAASPSPSTLAEEESMVFVLLAISVDVLPPFTTTAAPPVDAALIDSPPITVRAPSARVMVLPPATITIELPTSNAERGCPVAAAVYEAAVDSAVGVKVSVIPSWTRMSPVVGSLKISPSRVTAAPGGIVRVVLEASRMSVDDPCTIAVKVLPFCVMTAANWVWCDGPLPSLP